VKKRVLSIIIVILLPWLACAQGILNRVKSKVEQRANQKADQAIDKGLDKIEEDATKKDTSKETTKSTATKSQEATTTEPSSTDTPSKVAEELPMKAYASFDFVPGDSILFEDNFTGETLEEIPSLWVPTGGTIEISKISGQTVAGFLDGFYTAMYPRMKKYNYLPQRFSVEFDYLFRRNNGQRWSRYLADGGSAGLDIAFHSGDLDANNEILGDFQNSLRIESYGQISFGNFKGQYKGIMDGFADTEIYDRWVHISFAVTERGIKAYMNNQRMLNAPVGAGKAASITINGEGSTAAPDGHQLFIRNVRIAAGGRDPYKQLTSTTKATYIARGINFDYNKATLKPESMGELNKITSMLKEHPDLKFEIGGHTDADGDDASNLKLSQLRADTVKAKLVEMGTDASRLSTKGYGETKPVSDNETPEGKANNRRVELVRK